MKMNKFSNLQNFLYVISAFLITETIIRRFLEVLGTDVSPYALGGLGLLLFFLATSLSSSKWFDVPLILATSYLVLTFIALFLVREGFVTIWFLALVIYMAPLMAIIYLIRVKYLSNKKK